MAKSIKAAEQEHLDHVVAKIKVAEEQQSQTITRSEKDQADIKRDLLNNINIKTDSYEGMMETGLSVRQQQQMMDERQNSWKHATKQLSTLKSWKRMLILRGSIFMRLVSLSLRRFISDSVHFLTRRITF